MATGSLSSLNAGVRPSVRAATATESPSVLVVDDDPNVRILIGTALETHGFRVEDACDGEVGLERFEQLCPDLILCDVMMPVMDGFTLCGEIKRRCDHVPIVMLTGLEDYESIERAYSVGATEFIIKPINWALLPRRLRYILRASSAMRKLRLSEERYALAARGANDGLWDWDLQGDQIYFSSRWKEMLGYPVDQLTDKTDEWFSRVHSDDADLLMSRLSAHIKEPDSHLEVEYRICHHDGSYRWMLCRGLATTDEQGCARRIVGSQTDITQWKQAEAQLYHDAFHDVLTGLPNRSLFLDRLEHSMNLRERRRGFGFAVLFLDLDRFKIVNDSLGHLLGDRLLIEVTRRLSGVLRQGDTLARLGGDEFTFLLEDVGDTPSITRTADRILSCLNEPVVLDGQAVVVSASLGIASSATGYTRPEEMLRDADAAMYQAKAAGRGCYKIFDDDMHADAVHALQMETELRSAVQREEFVVHYQPIIDVESGLISGFEALIRWQHPTRGTLLPDEFLDVACETRAIVPIGRWVLREACTQMGVWRATRREASNWFVSVNLSSQELAQPDIVETVVDVLAKSDLPAANLKLEVTESSLINNDHHALTVMCALRAKGVQVSIDDFGTGYSSFNYLHQFPFDVLKIDRTFVHNLTVHPERLEIVKAIVTLAHNLNLKVVAEGSESREDLQTLRDLSCEYAQGFSVCRPMAATELETVLEKNRC